MWPRPGVQRKTKAAHMAADVMRGLSNHLPCASQDKTGERTSGEHAAALPPAAQHANVTLTSEEEEVSPTLTVTANLSRNRNPHPRSNPKAKPNQNPTSASPAKRRR